jgi:hypothetical protein
MPLTATCISMTVLRGLLTVRVCHSKVPLALKVFKESRVFKAMLDPRVTRVIKAMWDLRVLLVQRLPFLALRGQRVRRVRLVLKAQRVLLALRVLRVPKDLRVLLRRLRFGPEP